MEGELWKYRNWISLSFNFVSNDKNLCQAAMGAVHLFKVLYLRQLIHILPWNPLHMDRHIHIFISQNSLEKPPLTNVLNQLWRKQLHNHGLFSKNIITHKFKYFCFVPYCSSISKHKLLKLWRFTWMIVFWLVCFSDVSHYRISYIPGIWSPLRGGFEVTMMSLGYHELWTNTKVV